jgi:flagellar motor switch/type III secretory pathway protein FliN
LWTWQPFLQVSLKWAAEMSDTWAQRIVPIDAPPLPMLFSPDISERVLAACRQNTAEAAAALSRALGGEYVIEPEKIEAFRYAGPPPEWTGPGLVLVLKARDSAALVVIAASSGLVPDWAFKPDATAQSKLATLAQELSLTLLPEDCPAVEFQAGYVDSLAEAVKQSEVSVGAGAIHCVVRAGDKTGSLRLIWPAMRPGAALTRPDTAATSGTTATGGQGAHSEVEGDDHIEQRLQNLPSYVRSLLRISVCVSVQLAATKQPVSRILNIGPGSIIQFDKNCEQPLTLCVGNQPVAEGEAVKVGEKFGIKLTSIVLPGERFFALRGKRGRPS